MKFRGGSVVVLGAIKEDGTKILIKISNGYMDVLNKGLFPIYDRNALCHKSRVVSSFMNNSGICCLSDWPPKVPDLNIIEAL